MHELSLAAEIVRLVQVAAVREGFLEVAVLRLEAGALSGIEVDALRFALEAIAPGSCLAGASIEIDKPPGRAWCTSCENEVEIMSRVDPCPHCGAVPLRLSSQTLRIVDLLVRDD